MRVYGKPMRFRYDDPPYIGTAWRYYKMPEVNHEELIKEALSQNYDGYALSCSVRSLRTLLPLMPEGTRVCAWTKPHAPNPLAHGIANCWEVVLVYGGRQQQPGKRDWLQALPARSGGELPGRKPVAFAAWLYELFGAGPQDSLYEKYRGTGIVGRVWTELQKAALDGSPCDASSLQQLDVSPVDHGEVSLPPGDASSMQADDASQSSTSDELLPSLTPGLDASAPEKAPSCRACGDEPLRCEMQEGCELAPGEPSLAATRDGTLFPLGSLAQCCWDCPDKGPCQRCGCPGPHYGGGAK